MFSSTANGITVIKPDDELRSRKLLDILLLLLQHHHSQHHPQYQPQHCLSLFSSLDTVRKGAVGSAVLPCRTWFRCCSLLQGLLHTVLAVDRNGVGCLLRFVLHSRTVSTSAFRYCPKPSSCASLRKTFGPAEAAATHQMAQKRCLC